MYRLRLISTFSVACLAAFIFGTKPTGAFASSIEDYDPIDSVVESSKGVKNASLGHEYLYPRPCIKSLEFPSRGCVMTFSQRISDSSCFQPNGTLYVKNRNTNKVDQLFVPLNCNGSSPLEFNFDFWVSDPSSLADLYLHFQYKPTGCTGAPCLTHTVNATVAIEDSTVNVTQAPEDCNILQGQTTCSSQISWNNLNFAPHAGLFSRVLGSSTWTEIGLVNTSSGTYSIPSINSETTEVAIFQYAEDYATIVAPSGMLAGPFRVKGKLNGFDPLFLQKNVFSFLTSSSQDEDDESWNVLSNGTTLNLYGNTWKAIDYNYTVTANTWLKFDYKSEGPDDPEIAGIVLMDQNDIANGKTVSSFQIDGTQTYGNQWFNRYFNNGWKTYDLNVGHLMKTWSVGDRSIRYMGFMGDIDNANSSINISYRNPVLYNKSSQHLPLWGHSGNWYEPDTSGQGFSLEVNPINEMIIMQWFTYTEEGADLNSAHNRWYSLSGTYIPNHYTQDEVSLNIYQSTGGRFNLSNSVNTVIAGTAKIRFFDCMNAQVEYDFHANYNSGRSGSIPITRIAPNIDCRINQYAGPYKSDFGYTGNWHNSATSGQGFMFEVNPAAGKIVGQWFTFLPTNSGNLGNPNRQRWYNLVGSYTPGSVNTNSLDIYRSKGGEFDDPHPSTSKKVGTASVTFTSCTTGYITYNFTGGGEFNNLSGTINLDRITADVECD